MVWFQCEDCGENLKKPKLINHSRGCSARQFSCIDCGVVFDQQNVQGHTQCVSEAEKYGPKTPGCTKKEIMKSLSNEPNCDGMDTSLGLSTRAPWSCSLCNVKATSQETLLLHSEGKKHRSKVRARLSKQSNGDLVSNNVSGVRVTVSSADKKLDMNEHMFIASSNIGLSDNSTQNFKRKACSAKSYVLLDNGSSQHKHADSNVHLEPQIALSGGNNKEQIGRRQKRREIDMDQDTVPGSVRREAEQSCDQTEASFSVTGPKLSKVELEGRSKRNKEKHFTGDNVVEKWSRVVKWKKVIRRTLKNAPSGSLKKKRLCGSLLPVVMEVARKFGFEISKENFLEELEKQIESHAMFITDGKMVRLAVTDMHKECALA